MCVGDAVGWCVCGVTCDQQATVCDTFGAAGGGAAGSRVVAGACRVNPPIHLQIYIWRMNPPRETPPRETFPRETFPRQTPSATPRYPPPENPPETLAELPE